MNHREQYNTVEADTRLSDADRMYQNITSLYPPADTLITDPLLERQRQIETRLMNGAQNQILNQDAFVIDKGADAPVLTKEGKTGGFKPSPVPVNTSTSGIADTLGANAPDPADVGGMGAQGGESGADAPIIDNKEADKAKKKKWLKIAGFGLLGLLVIAAIIYFIFKNRG